jgi:hypothetical protein
VTTTKRKLLAGFFVCVVGVGAAPAATNSWNGGSGAWDTQNNWSLNKRPASDQDIVITNRGTFTVTLNDQVMANTLTVLSFSLSNASGASTLLITNRPSNNSSLAFRVLSDVVINPNSTLKLSDASSTAAGVRVVASNLLNDHTLTLATNASLVVSNLLRTATKPNQTATLTTAGGNVAARVVKLGETTGSVGAWTILAGTNLVGESLEIGSDTGTGIVNQTGGKLIVSGTTSDYGFSIAGSANSTGTVVLARGQIAVNGPLAIGERGVGSLIVSNGVLAAGGVDVGVYSGATGLWEIEGGTNNCSSTVTLGKNGGATGQLQLTGGLVKAPGIRVGDASGSVGTLTVASGKLLLPGESLMRIGNWGAGAVWQTGGELIVEGSGVWTPMSPQGIYIASAVTGRLMCSGGLMQASHVVVVSHDVGNSYWDIAGGTSTVAQTVAIGSEFRRSGFELPACVARWECWTLTEECCSVLQADSRGIWRSGWKPAAPARYG